MAHASSLLLHGALPELSRLDSSLKYFGPTIPLVLSPALLSLGCHGHLSFTFHPTPGKAPMILTLQPTEVLRK